MFNIGSVQGIRVGVRWTLPLALFLIVVFVRTPWALVPMALLTASTLLHELAHALVARRHGMQVLGVELGVLGGATVRVWSGDHRAELAVAVAGPLASA